MLRFYAAEFMQMMGELRKLASVLNDDLGDTLDTATREVLWTGTAFIRDTADRICLTSSVRAAERMMQAVEGNRSPSRLGELFRELSTVVQYELQDCMVFVIPQARAQYYNAKKPLGGSDIVNKLPDTVCDVTEAGNCFAVGRYTACVFHLMRVMEMCVQALGAEFGVSVANGETWQGILDSMQGAVKQRYPRHSSPERKTYAGVLSHLESVKIAWRNPTMHPKGTYTEEEARGIIGAVSIFTDNLATLL